MPLLQPRPTFPKLKAPFTMKRRVFSLCVFTMALKNGFRVFLLLPKFLLGLRVRRGCPALTEKTEKMVAMVRWVLLVVKAHKV
uniref:Uncharacterized protein n=1 Tax=Myoviridae sp. ctshb19 TaxID=2825194 RepID=A0A8S5UH99_9CAUD|nr:MAG TPA: hypothetical protein [Myoviridae sp. ctshb19]